MCRTDDCGWVLLSESRILPAVWHHSNFITIPVPLRVPHHCPHCRPDGYRHRKLGYGSISSYTNYYHYQLPRHGRGIQSCPHYNANYILLDRICGCLHLLTVGIKQRIYIRKSRREDINQFHVGIFRIIILMYQFYPVHMRLYPGRSHPNHLFPNNCLSHSCTYYLFSDCFSH